MPYCNKQDVEDAVGGSDRLIELIDWDHDGDADDVGASADDTRLNAKIAEATSWAARYISRRVSLATDVDPLTVDPSLRMAVAREVVYLFRLARQITTAADQERHDETLEWLRAVASGEATIDASRAPAASNWVGTQTGDREDLDDEVVLTRGNSGGFW